MAVKLLTLTGLKNEASASRELPTRLKVLNWGNNPTLKGDIVVDERTVKHFSTVQQKMGWDTIALDYEHNTVPGTTAYKESKDPRPVAAHLSCEVVPQDGVYCNVKSWTPGENGGKTNAKNYADLSPSPLAIEMEGENVLIGLHSVALTQHGAVPGLEFLSADFPSDMQAKLLTLSIETHGPNAYKVGGDLQTKGGNMTEHIKTFRAFLGMDGSTPDEEVMKCMSAEIGSGKITRKGPLDNAGGTSMTIKSFSADEINKLVSEQVAKLITPLSTNVTALTTAAQAATAATEKAQRDGLVAQATREGKVIPLSNETIATTPIAVLQEIVKSLQPAMKHGRGTPTIVNPKATGAIQKGTGKVLTLSVGGTEVPIMVSGGAEPRNPRASLQRTSQIFTEQLQRDGILS